MFNRTRNHHFKKIICLECNVIMDIITCFKWTFYGNDNRFPSISYMLKLKFRAIVCEQTEKRSNRHTDSN